MSRWRLVLSSSTISETNIIEHHAEQGTKPINLVANIYVSHCVEIKLNAIKILIHSLIFTLLNVSVYQQAFFFPERRIISLHNTINVKYFSPTAH